MTGATQKSVLLAASMWWPLSARLALELLDHSWTVSAICPPGHPLRYVSGIRQLFPYRRLSSLRSLVDALHQAEPQLIVPCDDGVVWQLHQLHAAYPRLRPLIEASLGDPRFFTILQSRARFLDVAKCLGVRTPTNVAVTSEVQLQQLANYPAVLKLDRTWGGNGVQMVRSQREAADVFKRFNQPAQASLAWKRLLVDADPLALWMAAQHRSPEITLQQLICGTPANTMLLCKQGQVLALLTVEVLAAQGPTGAATIVRVIDNREIEQAACTLANHLQLSGFHGLDFVVENHTGKAFLIELNPRCTQLGHLSLNCPSLAAHLGELLGHPAPPAQPFRNAPDTVAFFPQAITLNPRNPHLSTALHDVPWSCPALVTHLLQPPWPQRQWLARLYHRFRKSSREAEVRFDETPSLSSARPKVHNKLDECASAN